MLTRRAGLALLAGALSFDTTSAQSPPPGDPRLPHPPTDPTEILELWPHGAPGAPASVPVEQVDERSTNPQQRDRAIHGIHAPRLEVFRSPSPNGAAVLIIPGGGYRWIVIDKEGYELGQWFAARGVTAFVLFHRLPSDGWAAGPDVVLSDAQRAMRVIRANANKWGIDARRLAAMGFSAGGHACADLMTRFAVSTYAATDAADALSAKPFVAAPIYPVVTLSAPLAHAGSREKLLGSNATAELERKHSPHLHVTADTPPCFLLHAADDDVVPCDNSLLLHAALRAQGISVELHLFERGGHGFGLRGAVGKPVANWPDLFMNWARTHGWLD